MGTKDIHQIVTAVRDTYAEFDVAIEHEGKEITRQRRLHVHAWALTRSAEAWMSVEGLLDTQSGKELSVLAITKGVDDLVFDPASKRLYASCDGDVSVYQQSSPDSYKLLGKVPTGALARTALLVPQLNQYFVAVPQHGTTNAEILVFEVR